MLLIQCVDDCGTSLSKGHVYEVITYTSGPIEGSPVISIKNDGGDVCMYPMSLFKFVNIEDVST